MRKEIKYYIMIVILLIIYISLMLFVDIPEFYDRITTATAIIAAVVLWLQIHRAEKLNEANFIMNLNHQFISNAEMTKIESELEAYYNADCRGESAILNLNLSSTDVHSDRQTLINYLVYLESLSSIVKTNVLHLGVIDDLFAYRFFIAINNPVVQTEELIPYEEFYKGCFWLCKEWTNELNHKRIEVPLSNYTLLKWNYTSKQYSRVPVLVRKARFEDNLNDIASSIYYTDPYIYTSAFSEEIHKAKDLITKIIFTDDSIFSLRNIYVALVDSAIAGVVVINEGNSKWRTNDYINMLENGIEEKNFRAASERYFEPIANQASTDMIEIVCCSVGEAYRGKGIATALMENVISDYKNKDIELDVLADNIPAINVYRKCGFRICSTQYGFSLSNEDRPKCHTMKRCKTN